MRPPSDDDYEETGMPRSRSRHKHIVFDLMRFASDFERTCRELGITVGRACEELGISPSIVSDMKTKARGTNGATIAAILAWTGLPAADYVIDLRDHALMRSPPLCPVCSRRTPHVHTALEIAQWNTERIKEAAHAA